MPPKYHIHSATVPNRFPTITRSGVIAWEEGCLKCPKCVKRECVYGVYDKRKLDSRLMLDSLDSLCKDCFRCVQNCPNRLIHKALNPEYKALGDDYWTAEIISKLWYQAETGRIPVSGGGYGGPFSGPGFDAMWTDMSEIVRPTRDGIHGREYINTQVDLGRKHKALAFDDRGRLFSKPYPLVEIPIPILFDRLPWSPPRDRINHILLRAARTINTFAVITQNDWDPSLKSYLDHVMLYLNDDPEGFDEGIIKRLRLIELPDGPLALRRLKRLKRLNPEAVMALRLPLAAEAVERSLELAQAGVEIIHLEADEFGREQGKSPLAIKDRVKAIHLHLVRYGIRDQVTVIAGGGVAMAEHMAKLIICGADAVTLDIPLLVALECRVCRRCAVGIPCPVSVEEIFPPRGEARIRNLMAGWHNQLLEIMGAMGIREARRLRGEMGRAMFFEDLEQEIFMPSDDRSGS
jgi:ferredoxin